MSPYAKGALAARMGMEKDDNPYQLGAHAYSDWKAGYESSIEVEEAMELDYDWGRLTGAWTAHRVTAFDQKGGVGGTPTGRSRPSR